MSNLTKPPLEMSYANVRLIFSKFTDGDETRGFVPGYHFRILNEDGVDVGHLNVRVGDSEHVRLAAGHIGYEVIEEHTEVIDMQEMHA